MSNYEKEMKLAAAEYFLDEKERGNPITVGGCWEAGAKWQASRLTEEKIVEVLENYKLDFGDISFDYGVPEIKFDEVAKEIIALLKGEDEK